MAAQGLEFRAKEEPDRGNMGATLELLQSEALDRVCLNRRRWGGLHLLNQRGHARHRAVCCHSCGLDLQCAVPTVDCAAQNLSSTGSDSS